MRFDNRSRVSTYTSAWMPTGDEVPPVIDYLVVAGGGGGGGRFYAGGGGAGGLRSTVTATGGGGTLETPLTLLLNTNYLVTIGAAGVGGEVLCTVF